MTETVKAGYKQTEMGVIPEEWEVRCIGEMFDVSAGGDFDASRSSPLKDERHPYPIYSNAITDLGLYGFCSYCDHSAGSITVTARGTLGVANFRDHQYTAIGRVIVLQPNSNFDGRFFAEFINSQINFVVESTGVPQLTAPQISKYKLPVPPLPEQRTIAAALSDVDALLAKLDQLIAKKRDLKQAAMQQLLTGKTRLPGFSGEWEVVRLDEIFSVSAGGDLDPSRSNILQDEQYPYPIYSNTVADSGLYGFCSYSNFPAGSITVTARGTLGVANFRDHPYTAIGRVLVLQPKIKLDGRFFSEFINNRVSFVVESTGVPQLTAPQISKYMLRTPSFSEQTTIATILSDMDAEIAALEARRDKTRALKQGMMQELLTGRIRLV